jgi:hypothetical protein
VINGPATASQPSFDVRERDGVIRERDGVIEVKGRD